MNAPAIIRMTASVHQPRRDKICAEIVGRPRERAQGSKKATDVVFTCHYRCLAEHITTDALQFMCVAIVNAKFGKS